MILHVMLSSLLVGVCCALSAAVAEWTLSLRRGIPVRWIWVAALLTAVTMPLGRAGITALLDGARTVVTTAPSNVSTSPGTVDPLAQSNTRETKSRPQDMNRAAGRKFVTMPRSLTSMLTVPRLSRRASNLLTAVWLATSFSLCIALFWSARRLARERGNWERVTFHDANVLVSDGFGPALVGLIRPEIVLPPWVLTLDAAAGKTILAHEIEHRCTGDSRLIVSAMLLSIAMPWNPLLWWMIVRMVRAIEFDCDARVTSHGINTATYAHLLLGAWQHGMRTRSVVFSAAFGERRSKLGQRVNHLLRPEPRGKIVKTLAGATIALVLAALAVAAPAPPIAAAAPAPVSWWPRGGLPMLLIDGEVHTGLTSEKLRGVEIRSRSGAAEIVVFSRLDSVNARRLFGNLGANGAEVWWSRGYYERVGPQLPVGQMMFGVTPPISSCPISSDTLAQRVTARLISELYVTPAQSLEVDRIVFQYVAALRATIGQPVLVGTKSQIAITNSRDSALRLVLRLYPQRNRFEQIVADERRFLVPVGVRELADQVVRGQYFMDLPVSDGEIAAANRVVERSLAEEAAVFTASPLDSAALTAVKIKRDTDVRGILDSDAKRAAFDFRDSIIGPGRLYLAAHRCVNH